MNWFTTLGVAHENLSTKTKLVEQDGGCEHATKDPSLVYVVHYEKDSFGIVGSHANCEACYNKAEAEKLEEEHVCKDCVQTKPLKEGRMWRRWNHLESDGDREIFVCIPCRSLPKHVKRIRDDHDDYAIETGYDDSDD